MRRFWRMFRFTFLGVCFVGLGVYLVYATPWDRWFGTPRDYAPVLAQGDAWVRAVESFQRERGLWPQYLEDAGPLAAGERTLYAGEWFYQVRPMGVAAREVAGDYLTVRRVAVVVDLFTHVEGDPGRTYVGYDFDPHAPRWMVFGGGDDRVLRSGAPAGVVGGGATLPAAELVEKELAELDRRIARERGVVEHWQAKASLYMALERTGEARTTIAAAGKALPESYWPGLAAALFDLHEKKAWTPTCDALIAWARANPTLTHQYYAALLYRQAGRGDDAAAAMEAAIALPVAVSDDDPQTSDYYLWDMARWALRQEKWGLAIRITQAWEKAEQSRKNAEWSCLPLRAAALLGKGDGAGAKTAVAGLAGKTVRWAQHVEGPGGLRDAVERGDQAYRYEPGDTPGEFAIFELPQ